MTSPSSSIPFIFAPDPTSDEIVTASSIVSVVDTDPSLSGAIDHPALVEKAAAMAELCDYASARGLDLTVECTGYRDDFLRVGWPGPKVKNIGLWYRRALLKDARQTADLAQHRSKMIGRNGDQIVSKPVLASRRAQMLAQRTYFEKIELVKRDDAGQETAIKGSDLFKTPETRIAKLYVRTEGLDKFCIGKGLTGFFLTMTLPPRFHPNPSHGQSTWDGSTPAEGHRLLQEQWRAWQRVFGKSMSVRVEEQHRDGCPHWHSLVWIRPEREDELIAKIQANFGRPPASKIVKIDTSIAKASTYLMKYLIKATGAGDSESNLIAELADAHRATWGGRSIVISDIEGSATLWDEVRRVHFGSDDWLKLPGEWRSLHSAATTNDYYEFLKILCSLNVEKSNRRCSIWYETSVKGTRLVKGFIFDHLHINTHKDTWVMRKRNAN